jgi:hypothetical protein
MPNHVHLLFAPALGMTAESFMRFVKELFATCTQGTRAEFGYLGYVITFATCGMTTIPLTRILGGKSLASSPEQDAYSFANAKCKLDPLRRDSSED